MTKLLIKILAVTAVIFTLSACADDGPGDDDYYVAPYVDLDDPAPIDFPHLVAGPDLDGQWRSACVLDSSDSRYWDVVIMSYNDQAVTRDTNRYYDINCSVLAQTVEEQGQFRFTASAPNGIDYSVEYRFKAPDGGMDSTNEDIRYDGAHLWVDGFWGLPRPPHLNCSAIE